MGTLLRRLGPFDLALITFGAIVGSGIFRNPAGVAQAAHTPAIILAAWTAGGIVALAGAFVFAELLSRHPVDGGLYAILRDAYHPVVAFVFGWTLLLVAESGGIAAAGLTFASYIEPLFGWHLPEALVGATAIACVTLINLLGVRQGGTWQNVLVVAKMSAIAALVIFGSIAHPQAVAGVAATPQGNAIAAFFGALVPVMFAYNGFHVPSYVTGETRDPARTLPAGLLWGVGAVTILYIAVNLACLHVLGPSGLAASKAPAGDVMRAALGPLGARAVGLAVALSTLGFVSTKMLATPRVYFQMAKDRSFFAFLGHVNPKTRVPVYAIVLQAAAAIALAMTNSFEQIVIWVVSIEYAFVALAGIALLRFRRATPGAKPAFTVPLHPLITAFFILSTIAICLAAIIGYPQQTAFGIALSLCGAVVYVIWKRAARGGAAA